jgi:hypothetical protein
MNPKVRVAADVAAAVGAGATEFRAGNGVARPRELLPNRAYQLTNLRTTCWMMIRRI